MTTTLQPPASPMSGEKSPSRRRLVVALVVALVICAGAGIWLSERQSSRLAAEAKREREWRHGGRIAFDARISVVRGGGARLVPKFALQGFVIRTRWSGPSPAEGRYNFLLLDRRGVQPRPFYGTGGWEYTSEFEALARHYPWLHDTSTKVTGGQTIQPVSASVQSGRATVTFFSDADDRMVVARPKDLQLVVFLVGPDRKVRWAKQVPITTAR